MVAASEQENAKKVSMFMYFGWQLKKAQEEFNSAAWGFQDMMKELERCRTGDENQNHSRIVSGSARSL